MAAIIFDLDGTLIDSARDIHAAINRMLHDHEYDPLDLQTVVSFVGNGLPTLIERVLRHSSIDMSHHADMTQTALKHYSTNASSLTTLYDGAIDALATLRADGHKIGLCTNKPLKPTLAVLDAFDITNQFDTLVCGDSLATRKPDPEMLFKAMDDLTADQVIFVGDSEVDYETALNANVPFALFTQGYRKHGLEYFKSAAPFDAYADLPQLVGRLLHTT